METKYIPSNLLITTAYPTLVCHREPYPAIEAVQHTAYGKYVLITNASFGFGRAIAISWARAGAAGIAICSQNAKDLESVTTEIKLLHPKISIVAMDCDTTSSFDMTKLFSTTKSTFRRLDVVIANVGTSHIRSFNGTDDNDVWWSDVTTNFRTTHVAAQQYIRIFGPSPSGVFLSITSGANFSVDPGVSSHEFAQQIDCRLREFMTAEHLAMKAFSLDLGSVPTARVVLGRCRLETPKPELVGLFSVWLGGGRADQLRGNCLRVEWDIRELELDMEQARKRNSLRHSLSSGCLRLDTRQN